MVSPVCPVALGLEWCLWCQEVSVRRECKICAQHTRTREYYWHVFFILYIFLLILFIKCKTIIYIVIK
jgi:hypothetical protein